jgi:group II intron reverse transcriptase/maturase
MAYANLYANKGALTPGVDPEDTVDGMSLKRIELIREQLSTASYRWKPARRTYRWKRDGKRKRPIGMPGWNDKLLEEVIRIVLEAYYEPQFRESSHGFRPQRGCHPALSAIYKSWTGTKWFIEGDIRACFDSLNHEKIVRIIGRKIKDRAFLELLKGLLKAGYVEDWTYHQTYSGVPQGGVLSPLIMNIVLNELDEYIEDVLMPRHTKGKQRKPNAEYVRITGRMQKLKRKRNWERHDRYNQLEKYRRHIPSLEPQDPEYSRLRYVRYADDFLLGFTGTKAEAERIKEEIGQFLKTLGLELADEKTMITHASS